MDCETKKAQADWGAGNKHFTSWILHKFSSSNLEGYFKPCLLFFNFNSSPGDGGLCWRNLLRCWWSIELASLWWRNLSKWLRVEGEQQTPLIEGLPACSVGCWLLHMLPDWLWLPRLPGIHASVTKRPNMCWVTHGRQRLYPATKNEHKDRIACERESFKLDKLNSAVLFWHTCQMSLVACLQTSEMIRIKI